MAGVLQDSDLEKHRLLHLDAFYFPNFVTVEEEVYLIRKILESPQHKWKKLANRRLQLLGGELTAKGTLIAQSLPPFIESYPDIISRIKATGAFKSSPHGAPNHVILNEYLPGQGIMPHEDGPRYHPVVATISLGSHAVFHYYKYKAESETDDLAVSHGGKIIDMSPVLSVLLEPRSLIISSGAMYISHLHGIEGLQEDVIEFNDLARNISATGVTIGNFNQIEDEELLGLIKQGNSLKRSTRYSLTCRDISRVSKSPF
ncbi:hypothetical protein BYT27DRAFT_7205255 [Phlegmacium glaucopus]|nr:hypothetical protein BYT27DRAFT_7205255 [Phlegmacium glaucopus]